VRTGTVDCGPATGHLQLGEDVPGVGADGVVGDEEPPGDLGCGQLGVEEAQHLELPLTERVEERLADERLARSRAIRLGQEASGMAVRDPAVPSVMQKIPQGFTIVEEEPGVTVRLGWLGEGVGQRLQCLRTASLAVEDQGRQHVDLDDTGPALGGTRRPQEPREQVRRLAEKRSIVVGRVPVISGVRRTCSAGWVCVLMMISDRVVVDRVRRP
jgi:hypothetical protein